MRTAALATALLAACGSNDRIMVDGGEAALDADLALADAALSPGRAPFYPGGHWGLRIETPPCESEAAEVSLDITPISNDPQWEWSVAVAPLSGLECRRSGAIPDNGNVTDIGNLCDAPTGARLWFTLFDDGRDFEARILAYDDGNGCAPASPEARVVERYP